MLYIFASLFILFVLTLRFASMVGKGSSCRYYVWIAVKQFMARTPRVGQVKMMNDILCVTLNCFVTSALIFLRVYS